MILMAPKLSKHAILIGVATLIGFCLFIFMNLLIRADGVLKKSDDDRTYLNFVRIDASEQDVSKKKRQPPKEPPPPEEPPKSPQVTSQAAASSSAVNLNMNMPSMALPLNMGDGAFLGGISQGGGLAGFDSNVIPLVRIAPVYPRKAKLAKIQGYVTMAVTINPDGTVSAAEVLESDPARLFDASALAAIKRWKFRPKIVNGSPVSQRAKQTIEFKLGG